MVTLDRLLCPFK